MSGPSPYDPLARRDTPLALQLKARIRRDGALPVAAFMDTCLHDPVHGYYRSKSAIGRDGDFITAPEISQVFGELIGLWAVAVWQQMGAPSAVTLVEVGPGRGTLLNDALRASRIVPAFKAALRVVCVEPNPVLAALQRKTLAGAHPVIEWSDFAAVKAATAVSAAPHIFLFNEILDTLAVEHFVSVDGNWHARCVGLDHDGQLAFMAGPVSPPPLHPCVGDAADGAVIECAVGFETLLWSQAAAALPAASAGLFIDYGHERSAVGSTLQAVRRHAYEHPLTSPGEADLSAQVDFEAFAAVARRCGFAVDGPVTQAEFLGALGVMQRASRLLAANAAKANEIETAVMRLMAPHGMGTRFKAIGVRSPVLPTLPGLPARD